MAFINKEQELIKGFEIRVLEYKHNEKDFHEPYEIINIDTNDFIEEMTPDQLIRIAKKMIKYAKEVKKEYDEWGKHK